MKQKGTGCGVGKEGSSKVYFFIYKLIYNLDTLKEPKNSIPKSHVTYPNYWIVSDLAGSAIGSLLEKQQKCAVHLLA